MAEDIRNLEDGHTAEFARTRRDSLGRIALGALGAFNVMASSVFHAGATLDFPELSYAGATFMIAGACAMVDAVYGGMPDEASEMEQPTSSLVQAS